MAGSLFKHVTVIGLGKVGSLVATLLQRSGFEVVTFDQSPSAIAGITHHRGFVSDHKKMHQLLSQTQAVVSCLPYHLNLEIAKNAYELGIHYFDLTEDVETTRQIRTMARDSKGVMAPQCGLAPGFIAIVGAHLTHGFESIRSIELRVGALPQNPKGMIGYAFNWSPEGVVNEYLNDCEVIREGKNTFIPAMQDVENIVIQGVQLEAFSTSGGLGTMCETYLNQVSELNYKTLRYPGHFKTMVCFFHELRLKENRRLAGEILVNAKPPVNDDVVYVHAATEGYRDKQLFREEFVRRYYPITLDDKSWRAISWTTAASVVAVVELVNHGSLPSKGFIKQETIPFDAFLKTKAGELYATAPLA